MGLNVKLCRCAAVLRANFSLDYANFYKHFLCYFVVIETFYNFSYNIHILTLFSFNVSRLAKLVRPTLLLTSFHKIKQIVLEKVTKILIFISN